MDEEPLGAALVGGSQEAADATAESAVVCAQNLDLLLDTLIGFERRHVGRGRPKGSDEGMERLGAGAQTEDGPGAAVSPATQSRDQTCIDGRGLPAPRTTDQRNNAMLAELAQEFFDLLFAAKEQAGI